MRYYIIAGEASGDLHGARLVAALKEQDPAATMRCWGGDKMQAAGATLVKHYRELAFMGFVEVIKHLPTILGNLKFCKQDIASFQPDVLILIDYPGFNLRIAKWARAEGLKVLYYISPQVWAWKEGRVKQIKRDVDKMLVVLPFEKKFYEERQVAVTYVGHPLVEILREELEKPIVPLSEKKVIALLPGSRKQEIALKLPIMLGIVSSFPEYQFIVGAAPAIEEDFYKQIMAGTDALLNKGTTYNLLRQAEAALVTSGTATLETALLQVPQVVCYKGNPLSYLLAKNLIKVKYISLVNLIMDKEVVKELIQDELTPKNIEYELNCVLPGGAKRAPVLEEYKALWEELGYASTSTLAAQISIALAQKK